MTASFPIPLPHHHIRRMLERHATILIRTSSTRRGTYAIHDAMIDRRNHTRQPDEWQDPVVVMIEIAAIIHTTLINLDYPTVRQTGFKTQRDFYDDWLQRHRQIDPDLNIWVCEFQVLEDAWYLHHATDGGLTRDPAKAMRGEGQAVSPDELRLLGARAERKRETERRTELARRQARSLHSKMKMALRDGDAPAVRALKTELDQIADRIEAA